jgi:threonine synthase
VFDVHQIQHYCFNCGKEFPSGFRLRCDLCGGAIDVSYDLEKASLIDSKNPFKRYLDILPIPSEEYSHYMGEGNTRLIHAEELGNALGLTNLYLKLEGDNPTNTTKDRMAAVSLSYLSSLGINEFATSSTGNSSTSYGAYIAHFGGFKAHIFMGLDFIHNYRVEENPNIETHIVNGTFDQASDAAKIFAEKTGILSEGGFFNLGRREGLKLAVLEAYDQFDDSFDWLFQAVSSGMGIFGSYRGIKDYIELGLATHLPRMVCCQQSSNSPMVTAYKSGSPVIRTEDVIPNPRGIAHAILRGNPELAYPYIYKIVRETRGDVEQATLGELLNAMRMVFDLEGVSIGYSGAVALATLVKLAKNGKVGRHEKVLVNITDGRSNIRSKTIWKLWSG